ncbi:MAG: hypothetical protein U0354_05705 [Candidatus Sericytochromatia bacterium]
MSGDVRVSNPSGTSIYDMLAIKTEKPVQQEKPVKENTNISPEDTNIFEELMGNTEAPNVSLVDNEKTQSSKLNKLPLTNADTGEVLKFKVDKNGLPIIKNGEPIEDPNGKPVFVKVDSEGSPVLNENNQLIFVPSTGKIPASNVSLTDNEPKKEETQSTEETGNEEVPDQEDSGKIAPFVDKETGEPLKLKVDEKGVPILDANGQLQRDPNGKHVYFKVDKTGNPLIKDGDLVYVTRDGNSMPPLPPQVQKAMETAGTVMNTHSAKRIVSYRPLAKLATGSVSKFSGLLVKGVAYNIPFTSKVVGFGVKYGVAKAVANAGTKLTTEVVSKGAVTTFGTALKTLAPEATKLTVKGLKATGALGKGMYIGTKSMPTLTKAITSPVVTTQLLTKSAKSVATVIEREGVKQVAKKVIIGGGEKVLRKGVTEGIEEGVKVGLKSLGKAGAEKVITEGGKQVLTKEVVTVATKAGSSAGKKVASAIPIIGAVAGAALVALDVKDAIEKTKDKKATTTSKVLAWTTVALGTISTVCTATGVGAPIGWIATGLSIGTSIASDYFRYKK